MLLVDSKYMSSNYGEKIICEFDTDKRIFHLSATEKLRIETVQQLEELCSAVSTKLRKYIEAGRCYMLVDLIKFIIEPKLADHYAEKMQVIVQNCLYPNGLARYGYQITRMTVQIGHQNKIDGDPNLFGNQQEALDFIDSLIQQKSSGNQLSKS